MAKFCGNCGMQLEDDARVCGYCGAPCDGYSVDYTKNSAGVVPKKKKSKIKKIVIFSAIGVALIVIAIVAFNIISYMTGYVKTLDTFFDGLNEYDTDKMLSVAFYTELPGSSMSFEDSFDNSVSRVLDGIEEEVGHDPKISYEIEDPYTLSDRKFQTFVDYLEKNYKYNTDEISEIVCTSLKVTAYGARNNKTTSPAVDVYLIKEDGKWLVYLGSTSFMSSSSSSNSGSLFN